MANLSARIDDDLSKRIVDVIKVYGGTQTSVIENALECWLDAFETAPEAKRLQMIVRPKHSAKRTRRVAA